MPRVVPFILAIAVWIYGVIDCAQTPEDRVPRGLKKPVWLIIVLLIPVIGSLAWLGVKWVAGSSSITKSGGYRSPKRKGPTAPDDDPEFLANLDWQARKAHYERQKREQQAREASEKAGGTAAAAEEQDVPAPKEPSAEAEAPAGEPGLEGVDWDRLAEQLGDDTEEDNGRAGA
nr:PLDc_N domain-containing protein [Actinomycetales bacterium]